MKRERASEKEELFLTSGKLASTITEAGAIAQNMMMGGCTVRGCGRKLLAPVRELECVYAIVKCVVPMPKAPSKEGPTMRSVAK